MFKSKNIMTFLLLGLAIFSFCNNIKAQGKIKAVKIGSNVWMTENLNVDHFRNGDPIPEAKTDEEWIKARKEGKPAWCHPQFDKEYDRSGKSGKLYNWFAVRDNRELAPKGWHLPTVNEVDQLNIAVDMDSNRLLEDGVGNGTNSSGFSALVVPYCAPSLFSCGGSSEYISFWMSYQPEYKSEFALHLQRNKPEVKPGEGRMGFGYGTVSSKGWGLSVRCVKD